MAREHKEREHSSDRVFRALAAAIINHELVTEAPLPPERLLSERFGISRIIVREAVHRLKSYGLVRVQQGSLTTVLDPDRAPSVGLLALELELMAPCPERLAIVSERLMYSGAALLGLAEQHIESRQVDELEAITERLARGTLLVHGRAYWTLIAACTKNRFYVRETAWYFDLLERRPHLNSVYTWLPEQCTVLHRRLNGKLRERHGSAAAYLQMLRTMGS